MNTSVVIPYSENKNLSLLILFGFLKDYEYPSMSDIGDKFNDLHNGKDVSINIATDHLPSVLKRISDDGFIYKADALRDLGNKELNNLKKN